MRILYHHRIKSMDGQYVHIEELVTQLKALGHDLSVVGPVSESSAEFGGESKVLTVFKNTLPSFLYEILEFAYSFFDFLKMVRAARKFKPDIIYERFNLFTPSGIWVKKLLGIPLILEVNAPLVEERDRYGGLSLKRLAVWTQRYTWTESDCVIVVTNVLKKTVEQYGVSTDRIHVMPNGVNPVHFRVSNAKRNSMRKRLDLEGRFVIGFTGFIREWHGLERILEVMTADAFADAVLLIVGDGPARGMLVSRAAELGIEHRLKITGVVQRPLIPEYISTFDVAIQPNVVEYASPLKVLEYLAMERAIIAPDVPNIRELLSDRQNALLFDNETSRNLQQLLESVMRDDVLRQALGSAAGQTIGDRGLTWERNAERVEKLAYRLVSSRKGIGKSKPKDVC